MPLLLITDDNKMITSILEEYARKSGYDTAIASDGEEALVKWQTMHPDLLLLDVMMPGRDGFEVCREIRKTSDVPIIMVTARGEDYDRIMGLETGADDYIVKPFSPGEVMARVKAVLRRMGPRDQNTAVVRYENLTVNIGDYSVLVGEEKVSLSKREVELLWMLLSNRNMVYTRDQLLDLLWGFDYYGDSRTVDSHIKRLRAKLDDYEHPRWEIKTIWGVGYKFEGVES